MPTPLTPSLDGSGRRIAIVAARFTREISDQLVARAVEQLKKQGVADADITLAWVPGAFELPLICAEFASSGRFDGVLGFGCVIRGETSHYDYVCSGATDGILRANLDERVPVLFGVLTTENRAQAQARADGTKEDKGAECAAGVLEMIGLVAAIRGMPAGS